MKDRLSNLLNQKVTRVDKLFGDASYRAYFRIGTENGSTFILMEMPAGKMSVSEEITNIKDAPKEVPFLNVQRYLKAIGIPVPEMKLFSDENRWILLEDLSDVRFFDLVEKASPQEWLSWYKKAIDLLVLMQQKTAKHVDKKCLAFQRSFDQTLFNWEFDHFWEYYIEAQGKNAEERDKKLFVETSREITKELCLLPQGFTHRDFQSRNLMFHRDHLYLIDFQDALLGPKVYDLVALLRDSYFDVTSQLPALIDYYCKQSGEDPKKIWRAFDLQTIQRKLKDAGRFVFIDRVKKNPNFLPFMPTSVGYVKQALQRHPEYTDFYMMLKKYIKDWE